MITALLLAVTPSPSATSTATPALDADLVTPGLSGAVLLFFMAVAVYFLGRSMARRVRRVNQRAQLEAEERAEAEEAAVQRASASPDDRDGPAQS